VSFVSRVRTFIAVELDPTLRDRLASLQRNLAKAAGDVHWVDTANLHVTLLFLGAVELRDMSAVCNVVSDVCAHRHPFSLALRGVGCFPNPNRPRVLYAHIDDGAVELRSLHDDLEGPLERLGTYRREERPYTPHVTLGRVRSAKPPSSELVASLARQGDWQGGDMIVSEVRVFSSELRPQGPVYTVLARAPFAADGPT
jgi:2'-5' RNA ligase